jgi:surface antigen
MAYWPLLLRTKREQRLLSTRERTRYRMRFRRNRHAPPLQTGFPRLPSLHEQDGRSRVGSETQAFRAALRGAKLERVTKINEQITASLPGVRLADRHMTRAARRPRRTARRRLTVTAAVLLVLAGVGVWLSGIPAGLLAFGLSMSQRASPARSGQVLASHPGMTVLDTPTPLPTDTPTPLPPTATPRPPTPTPRPQPTAAPAPDGPYSNWTPPPGYSSFAVQEPPNDPWAASFGQCTWWVHYKRPDENLAGMGDAWNWANAARARGLTVTTTPAANATVVFAAGVQGAGNLGHVSHVEKVLTDTWVLVSEMNFSWNGGGFARVDYRYIHTGSGVWFIH